MGERLSDEAPGDPVHPDGATNYERLLRAIAPLIVEHERMDDGDSTPESVIERYRERPIVGAMDAHDAVQSVLASLRLARERLEILRQAAALSPAFTGVSS